MHHLSVHPFDNRLDALLGLVAGVERGVLRDREPEERHRGLEALDRPDAEHPPRLPEYQHPVQSPVHGEPTDCERAIGGERRHSQQPRIGGGFVAEVGEGPGLPDRTLRGDGELAEGELDRRRIHAAVLDDPPRPEQVRAGIKGQVRHPGVPVLLGDDAGERDERRLERGGPAKREGETRKGAGRHDGDGKEVREFYR